MQSLGPLDPLEAAKNNPAAIKDLMELYNIDEETATKMWHNFIGTVIKMRALAESQKENK